MAEINLMDHYPKTTRPIEERGVAKLQEWDKIFLEAQNPTNQEILIDQLLSYAVRKFDREYFDGDRLYGYGGYYYDPRFWTETVRRFRDHYKLSSDVKILDVGCAKGFMMHDFKKLMPNLHIEGLDISRYAYENAIEDMKPFIKVGNARELPYPDHSFDLVISINTVDHLPVDECQKAIQEIQRVSKKHAFITVNSWHNEEEQKNFAKWNRTVLTLLDIHGWEKLFKNIGYEGDYCWFIPH